MLRDVAMITIKLFRADSPYVRDREPIAIKPKSFEGHYHVMRARLIRASARETSQAVRMIERALIREGVLVADEKICVGYDTIIEGIEGRAVPAKTLRSGDILHYTIFRKGPFASPEKEWADPPIIEV